MWLIDVNPWAERTDPLLFSWREILERDEPPLVEDEAEEGAIEKREDYVEMMRAGKGKEEEGVGTGTTDQDDKINDETHQKSSDDENSESDSEEEIWTPEFRLVNRDDPEAYAFNTPRYSAHKLPKDVVDAGGVGEGGIREFLGRWRELERRQGEN